MPKRRRRDKVGLQGPPFGECAEAFLERYVRDAPEGAWAVLCTKEGKYMGASYFYDLDEQDHTDMEGTIDGILGEDPRVDFYISVSVQSEKPARGKRGTELTALAVRGAYLDIDWKDAVDPRAKDILQRGVDAVLALPIGRPTAIVASGAGLHVWYFYEHFQQVSDPRWKGIAKEAQKAVHGVAALNLPAAGLKPDVGSDLVKLLRVPGTYNLKRAEPAPVRLVYWDPERTYYADELLEDARPLLRTASPPTSPVGKTLKRRSRSRPVELEPIAPIKVFRTRLSPRANSVLDEAPVFQKRSHQTFKAVLTLLEDGWSDGQILYLVTQHHEPTKSRAADGKDALLDVMKLLERERERHDHEGRTCEEAACPNFRGHNLPGREAYLIQWQRSAQWLATGPNKASQWLLAFALAGLARKIGSHIVDADQRTLAEAIGANREATAAALRALEAVGVVVRSQDRQRTKAQQFVLRLPRQLPEGRFDEVQVLDLGDIDSEWREVLDPSDDLWAHGSGYNKSGYFVVRALATSGCPMTPAEIAQQSPHRLDTVTKALHGMQWTVVDRDEDGRWALVDDVLLRLWCRRGRVRTRGRRARRKARHAQERSDFHAWVAQQDDGPS